MKIKKNIVVPTGNICIAEGELGKDIEFLSLGDYGRQRNVKADFLGLTDEISGVANGDLLPLEDKWVITISSQYGCSQDCKFCSVPQVGAGLNASMSDLVGQFKLARGLHPEVKGGRINLHYARMGEPTLNPAVIKSAYYLKGHLEPDFKFHPVVSTMMPHANVKLQKFLSDWLDYKRFAEGDAGLQLSINTTDHDARNWMFSGNCLPLEAISGMFYELLRSEEFIGRKITLNFALTGHEIDATYLRSLFSPRYFMCKLTPIHATPESQENGMRAEGYNEYDIYRKPEEDLKAAGFDVLVFVPSREEDESRITCGNAILSDKA